MWVRLRRKFGAIKGLGSKSTALRLTPRNLRVLLPQISSCFQFVNPGARVISSGFLWLLSVLSSPFRLLHLTPHLCVCPHLVSSPLSASSPRGLCRGLLVYSSWAILTFHTPSRKPAGTATPQGIHSSLLEARPGVLSHLCHLQLIFTSANPAKTPLS